MGLVLDPLEVFVAVDDAEVVLRVLVRVRLGVDEMEMVADGYRVLINTAKSKISRALTAPAYNSALWKVVQDELAGATG